MKGPIVITVRQPKDWRALQEEVARILRESGMKADVERTIPLARGEAEVDVLAVETSAGRQNIIFCECKQWANPIPQHVIHAFRTVLADGGANTGYIITSSRFQRGALAAASLTNLHLVTWEEFQSEFESTWIKRYLKPQVTEKLDEFLELTEPLRPRAFENLSETGRTRYLAARERHFRVAVLAMAFTTYAEKITPEIPALPLRERVEGSAMSTMPATLLDAVGYRDLLDVLIPYGESAAAELRQILHSC